MKTHFTFLKLPQDQFFTNVSYGHSLDGGPDILNSGSHLLLKLGRNDHLELYRLFDPGLDLCLI